MTDEAYECLAYFAPVRGAVACYCWRSTCRLCNWFPAVDLAPTYNRLNIVVPASWHGSSPFVEAKPSDGELRPDWWTTL